MEVQGEVYLSEDLFVVGLNCTSKEEVIETLSNLLVSKGLVKDTYLSGILEREQQSPTGLRTKSVGVAIPHTQPEHVNSNSFAVGVLEKPVIFADMLDPSVTVEVRIVFLLALTESSKHIDIMKKVMGLFKVESTLHNLLTLSQEQLFSFFDQLIKGKQTKL
ncbi:PTS sugar transporter subunit IIA [Paenibacillus alkaliterrae]|uniref:PTS sugar transporter subunit IIA n=1 Tax=Paenibacillus alkaliterrae TaxID=320909 RepID=UPI001F1BB283|nr:PTS sugar transporter subunit IIA [Paenibacillus alkaliterrae]MCF2941624.1 PTS sugar transporter subunit IIA [Paenibacillus alkaliterrae]